MSGFKDKCAPFVYIAECPPKERDALMVASRVWLVLNSIALLALVVTFIRRLYLVKEKFNTLRLVMIKFMLGIPLYVPFLPAAASAWVSNRLHRRGLIASSSTGPTHGPGTCHTVILESST
jgi:Na+/proline symporter